MRRWVLVVAGTLLLTGGILAGPQGPKKEASIHCALTGKNVKKCCCAQRGEKLYCKLAKKTIDKCCCEPPQFPKNKEE